MPHLSITGTDPVDITQGLASGRYIAQVQGDAPSIGVRYASAAAAPDEPADYFVATGGESFRFQAGCADGCWVIPFGVSSTDTVRLAVARV